MRPHDDDEDHDEDHHDDVGDVDHVRATTDAHDYGDRDDGREKSTPKADEPTTRNDDSCDCCFADDDRDDSADIPDEETPRTTVAITTGGCGLPSGFVGNVRVTTSFHQGPCRVASPSAPAECRSSPSALPAWTLRIPSNETLHIPSHAWLEVGVGKCCSCPPPPPATCGAPPSEHGGALRS